MTLLDVRTPGEYADGHAEGFVNLPVDDLRERLWEVPVGKPVYVICQSGLRSYIACRILAQQGFKCYNLSAAGGCMRRWCGTGPPHRRPGPAGWRSKQDKLQAHPLPLHVGGFIRYLSQQSDAC